MFMKKTWMPATSAGMTVNTVEYSKDEIGRVRIVEDFLPPPDRLVPREG
jgi:hypothetical protein